MATHGGEIVADELMLALLTGEDVTIPVIDLDSTEFQIPGNTNSDAYSVLSKLSNADLTTGSIAGTGTFDKLMVGVAAQLKGEFDNNRITGAEYTKAYIGITQSALSIAAQFLLGKDSAYWQAVQAQALAVTARLQLQTAKIQNAAVKFEAMTAKANYALSKLKLSTLDTEYATGQYNLENLLPSQLAQTNAQTSLLSYDLTTVKPAEVANLNKQGTLLDSQKLGQDTQNDTAIYNLATVLPSQVSMTNAQKLGQDKQTETANYNLINLLPKQNEVLAQQVLSAIKDTQTKEYTYAYILPIQRLISQEQAEAARAQTMDVRSDNITAVAGSIGKQNSLYAQQIVSYQKDSQLKAAKVFSDVWITCRSIDEGFPLPTQFDTAATQAAMQAIITANGLG